MFCLLFTMLCALACVMVQSSSDNVSNATCAPDYFKSSTNGTLCANLTKTSVPNTFGECRDLCCATEGCGAWYWCVNLFYDLISPMNTLQLIHCYCKKQKMY